MEFSKIQEELSERCSNCFCEMVPSKIEIPSIKVEGDGIRIQSTEIADNFGWLTENSEFNVFEAVAFINHWTTEEFTDSFLTVLKLEYSHTTTEPFPFLFSVCATCKSILLQLFRLSQEFNELSSKHSIISRIREFHQSKYESQLNIKPEPLDNSDLDGCVGHDSFLSDSRDFIDTNLLNGNDYGNDDNDECHTPDEIPPWRTRTQKPNVARPVKKLEVNMKKKARANTVCNDLSVTIQRLSESLVKAYSGSSGKRSLRLRIKKEIPEDESKYFESETEDTDIVPRQQNYKKKEGSKNKLLQKYTCDRCDRKFRTKKPLDMHKRMHMRQGQDLKKARPKIARGPGPYKCPHCPKLLKHYDSFVRYHLRAHETDLSVICDACGKRYNNKYGLKMHERLVHPEEGSAPKKPPCPICGKSVRILRVHMKVHDKDREKFTCEQCRKTFKSKYGWQDHVDWAHSGQKFICATCGNDFQTKGLLRAHERIHSTEKRYPCDMCKMSFRHRYELEKHKASHSDTRPYLCNLCGKDFKRPNHFLTHMQEHKNKELGIVFSCSQCTQTFSLKRVMTRHIKCVHGDESKRKQNACPTCSKCFRDSYNLKIHRRDVHKEDV